MINNWALRSHPIHLPPKNPVLKDIINNDNGQHEAEEDQKRHLGFGGRNEHREGHQRLDEPGIGTEEGHKKSGEAEHREREKIRDTSLFHDVCR